MYRMLGCAEKLEIQNCVNSTRNCVHYRYGLSGFAEILNLQNCVNSTGNCVCWNTGKIVYIICTYSLDVLKIEYPELRKFNRKLLPLYVWYVWIVEKLKIQNCVNSIGNWVHYSTRKIVYIICTDCLDLLKNWISRIAYNHQEIVYIICRQCLDL